jgi:uncharacterized membrane protein YsdA (DUF1294 family)
LFTYAYWGWLAILSLITFILYGMDKDRAKREAWRIPEATLHWLALLGGFTGAWLGRAVFHHKTRKGLFTFILVLSTLIHAGIIYLLFLY